MIKRFLYILIFFSLTISSFAQKGDMVSFQKKETDHHTQQDGFLSPLYLNPSLQYYRFDNSLTTVKVEGTEDRSYRTRWIEEGRERMGIKVNAESYIVLTPDSRVWGQAYYLRGKRRNVRWNESSDFDRIYPYVSADTLGGDLTEETYYFKGGYTHRLNRWTLGIEAHYRALLEFRKVDPRPLNSIAELQGRIAASYALCRRNTLSLFLDAQKYKQNDKITYFNELGVSKTFHLLGLGTSYKRFDGTNNQIVYEGSQWRTGIDFLPVTSKGGFLAAVHYRYDNVEKIITNFQTIPLNEIHAHTMDARLGWLSAETASRWGLQAEGSYGIRKGSDMIYGDASGNQYPLLSTQNNFKMITLDARLNGFWEMKAKEGAWYCGTHAQLGYVSHEESNHSSRNTMTLSHLDLRLSYVSTWQWKKDMLRATVSGAYLPNLSGGLKIYRVADPYAETILRDNFNYFTADKIDYSLRLRWTHVFHKIALFLEGEWGQRFAFGSHNGQLLDATIGISF